MAQPIERINTTQNIERLLGRTSNVSRFLELRSGTVSGWEDDFQGDTLNATYQSTAAGANSAVAAISTGVVNGAILLDPGDANAGRSDLSWGLHYQGQLNAVYIARFSISLLTNCKFEIGFTDTISGTDAGAVNLKATPTFTADDAVVLVYDTNDDTNLTLAGVAATVVATAVDFSTVLSAATYYYFGVALIGNTAKGFVLDAHGRKLEEQTITSAVTATTLLTPWLFVQNRTGAQHTMTVDYHRAYQRRTSAL